MNLEDMRLWHFVECPKIYRKNKEFVERMSPGSTSMRTHIVCCEGCGEEDCSWKWTTKEELDYILMTLEKEHGEGL